MASFKTHISGGAVLGTSVGVLTFVAGATGSLSTAVMCTGAAVIGSVAPDIDSDTSVPFHVTFGVLSLGAGAATFVHVLRHLPGQWLYVIGASLAAALFVWLVIGWIFKRFTRHRGMVHSIPAAVLGSLLVFLSAAHQLNLTEWQSFLLALSFCAGFLLHLILDELYSFVNFHGIRFAPKKSLGSALKLFSSSHRVNAAVYIAIIAITYVNQTELITLTRHLFGLIIF